MTIHRRGFLRAAADGAAPRQRAEMARVVALALALAAGLVTATHALAQTGEGWISLFDGKSINDEFFDRLGETNWRVEDGAIVADKVVTRPAAFLDKDVQVYIEFWNSEDGNSGIFVRCSDRKRVHPRTCYEANIFDIRKDPTYGTGAIAYFTEVNPMPKTSGKWNSMEVTAKGRDITVLVNGQQTAKLRNGLFEEGPFALQHNDGTIKFRKIVFRPL
jgi:hypothetical protein